VSYVIVEDRQVPIACDVIDGRTLGRWFDRGPRGTRERTEELRAVVWHHTGGEGSTDTLFRVLHGGRRSSTTGEQQWLSVHFHIDNDGRIVQLADLAHVAQHAGKANGWSIGIEIANKGRAPALPATPRARYRDMLNGRPIELLRFHAHQVRAALALAPELSRVLAIPYRLPVEEVSGVRRATRHVLSPTMIASFRGHLGHYHLTNKKIDPVPHLLDEMMLHSDFEETPTRPAKMTPSRGFPTS
jgi:hypothetical protein